MASDDSVNMILLIIPNIATLAASSIPATANTRVGIPFATPYPLDLNLKRHGTTTAGETAAIIDPSKKAETLNKNYDVSSSR